MLGGAGHNSVMEELQQVVWWMFVSFMAEEEAQMNFCSGLSFHVFILNQFRVLIRFRGV